MDKTPRRKKWVDEADLMANSEIYRDNNEGASYISFLMLKETTIKVMKEMGIVDDNLNAAFLTRHTLHNVLNTHRMTFAKKMTSAEAIKAEQNKVFRESPDTVFLVVSTKSSSKVNLSLLATKIKQRFIRQTNERLFDDFEAYGYDAGKDTYAIIRFAR